MSWLTQFFLNPTFVVPGAALATLPIIIHLLSRLRYKKVRFAAMEFLLQSDELNRRRLIIEQLLLLLLRVLAVLLIMLLLARLLLGHSRLLLGGATTHHVLVLDDSLSMRQVAGKNTVFKLALTTLRTMLSEGGSRPGAVRVSVLTTTQPERPLIIDQTLNKLLVHDLNARLDNLECSYRAAAPAAALAAAHNILSGSKGGTPLVHVLTDLRRTDWTGQPEIAAAFASLDTLGTKISLIQVAKRSVDNVVLTQMSSKTLAVAAGVPWRLNLSFRNHAPQKSSGLRATVYIDGKPLPVKVLVPDIDPNDDAPLDHDIVFESAGPHTVEVRLDLSPDEDGLPDDNSRFLAVDVTDRRHVLIVDDEAAQEDSGYVAAAMSADPQLTGLEAEIRRSDALTAEQLDGYDCIYLLNVRELPADAVLLLAEYVADGGGIAWFPDQQANRTWYNSTLINQALFPVPLGTIKSIPDPEDGKTPQFQSPVFEVHPVFEVYNIPDLALADMIRVSGWFGIAEDWKSNVTDERDVRVLARLGNGDPFILEHTLGNGRVIAFLTSAGRRWTNWPIASAGPGYVVMHLLMHQYLQKPSRLVQVRELGDPVRFDWAASEYTKSVEVFLPVSENEIQKNSVIRLQAGPVKTGTLPNADDSAGEHATTDNGATAATATTDPEDTSDVVEDRLSVTVAEADHPGVYRIKRYHPEGQSAETWLALSVPASESDLTLAEAADVERLAKSGNVRVISADVAARLAASDADREIRWILLALLIGVLVCEQLLSLRMSFHPEVNP